jgi:hypothetical protein
LTLPLLYLIEYTSTGCRGSARPDAEKGVVSERELPVELAKLETVGVVIGSRHDSLALIFNKCIEMPKFDRIATARF